MLADVEMMGKFSLKIIIWKKKNVTEYDSLKMR